MSHERKKSWKEKVDLVIGSYNRSKTKAYFIKDFYDALFFLNPNIRRYFEKTDFAHQEKALSSGLEYLMLFLDQSNVNARTQILRISHTHSHLCLNIHPHDYYYWIDALIMAAKKNDPSWFDDLEYYWREVIFFPVSFIMSQYYREN